MKNRGGDFARYDLQDLRVRDIGRLSTRPCRAGKSNAPCGERDAGRIGDDRARAHGCGIPINGSAFVQEIEPPAALKVTTPVRPTLQSCASASVGTEMVAR